MKNRYQLPIIDELLDELEGITVVTSLDMRMGYHKIRMEPKDEHMDVVFTWTSETKYVFQAIPDYNKVSFLCERLCWQFLITARCLKLRSMRQIRGLGQ